MSEEAPVAGLAFLVDVDNTLLDNDAVKADLDALIVETVGADRGLVFWDLYDEVRRELDYVDLPHTLGRFAGVYPELRGFARLADLVLSYPFASSMFPGALETIAHLRTMGTVAILSDGDPVFQPAKIARAGLLEAVDGPILVYAHKEQNLDDVAQRVPAAHHVIVDDKPSVLESVKRQWGDAVTTVHVVRGRYANAGSPQQGPAPQISVADIGDLQSLTAQDFLAPVSR